MKGFTEIPTDSKSLYMRKPIFGIGINDANYQVQPLIDNKRKICPYYKTWKKMLERCYSDKYHIAQPTYKECFVCKEWLTFSNFKSWMINQDWLGKQLDKDLLVKGNKEYSPDTCVFVTSQVNSLLNTQKANRGVYVLGVSWKKAMGKYQAQCSVGNACKALGYYLTEEEARQAYLHFKKELIITVANEQKDIRVKNALLKAIKTLHEEE